MEGGAGEVNVDGLWAGDGLAGDEISGIFTSSDLCPRMREARRPPLSREEGRPRRCHVWQNLDQRGDSYSSRPSSLLSPAIIGVPPTRGRFPTDRTMPPQTNRPVVGQDTVA